MIVVIHNHRLESSAEQLSFVFVRPIEALGIYAVNVPYAAGNVAVWGMD